MVPLKVVLYASDIEFLLGCSQASAYRLIRKIRRKNDKPVKSLLSVGDFCAFTGLKYEEVMFALNGRTA